jgi:macrolide transport system ATP-binding/permease protein
MVLETFAQDMRLAIRTLRRTPVFVATAVLTLGIGLGLNTMLFTLFNAYVLRTVAVQNPYSLYQLSFSTKKGSRNSRFSWEQYEAIRAGSPAFSDSLAANQFYARVDDRSADGLLVSGNYFTMLGVKMTLGRFVLPEDASTPGARAVVVLTDRLWKSRFASDPGVLGRKVLINGRPFEVIGVCSPDFTGLGLGETPEEFYVPLTMTKELQATDPFGADKPAMFSIVGRVANGVSAASAQAALSVELQRVTEDQPEADRAVASALISKATILPLEPQIVAAFSPLILAFLLVLMICCANVANMMLARAIARQREIGVRLALGATRSRLVRQLLAEGSLLAILSAAVALAVASVALSASQRLLFATLPATFASLVALVPLTVDRNVFVFVVLAAGLTTILSGLAPALQATRVSLTDAMRGEFSPKLRPSRLRYALVVSQITVCLLLLVVTGVLTRSSASVATTDVGYDTRGVVFPIYDTAGGDLNPRLMRYLSSQSWVESTAATTRPPLGGISRVISISLSGQNQTERAGFNMVSSGYFELLGIPILRGRNFSQVEMDTEAPVTIVSQATARHLWPGQEAVGQTIEVGKLARGEAVSAPNTGPAVVVGIAKDVVSGVVWDGLDPTMIYFPTSLVSKRAPGLLIRTRLTSAKARNELEAALKKAMPEQAAVAVSMEDEFAMEVYPFRAASLIGFVLGSIALVLTISGMYGVISYLVSQRTKEIGVRMALGASPGNVVGLILTHSGKLALLGMGLGAALSLVLCRVLGHFLYMIRVFDAAPYLVGVAVVATASAAAAFIPSVRASRINPVETLRAE